MKISEEAIKKFVEIGEKELGSYRKNYTKRKNFWKKVIKKEDFN